MKLMAIDPGTNEMGIMYDGLDRPITLSLQRPVIKWKNKKIKPLREWRLADMMEQLDNLFKNHANHTQHIDTVIYERPFCRGADATRSLWGIAGIIEAVATKHGCTCLDIDNVTLKHYALGKAGGAVGVKRNKNPMIEMASVLGYDDLNEHEADAVLLYHYGIEHIELGD